MLLQGVRTYVAGNSPAPDVLVQEGKLHNETWSYYPDDAPLRSLYGGDTRAALVPYLAHASFGDTYKWLLYGDDDTVWFMESVMRLLQDFDPDLPYFITGQCRSTDTSAQPGMCHVCASSLAQLHLERHACIRSDSLLAHILEHAVK